MTSKKGKKNSKAVLLRRDRKRSKRRKRKALRRRAQRRRERERSPANRARSLVRLKASFSLDGTDRIIVYRGTRLVEELRLWDESDGYVYSEAARDGYYTYVNDGYFFREALIAGSRLSELVLHRVAENWGGVIYYSAAHSEFGTEFSKAFGPRPAISWTTDLATARQFAGDDGYVLTASVLLKDIVNPNWRSNEEREVLLANVVWAPKSKA